MKDMIIMQRWPDDQEVSGYTNWVPILDIPADAAVAVAASPPNEIALGSPSLPSAQAASLCSANIERALKCLQG